MFHSEKNIPQQLITGKKMGENVKFFEKKQY